VKTAELVAGSVEMFSAHALRDIAARPAATRCDRRQSSLPFGIINIIFIVVLIAVGCKDRDYG